MTSTTQKVGKEVARKKFRLSRVAQRFVQEHEEQSHTLGKKKQRGQNGRSLNALSHEQLGSCAELTEANMEFARKKACDVHKNMKNVKKDSRSNSSDHRTEQHKRKLSHLGQIFNRQRRVSPHDEHE